MAAASQPMTPDPSQHGQELIKRLDSLRRNGNLCDVTVTIKGKEFKAHKAVLAAASPFFLSLLESNMRESNEQLIRIELEEATTSVMEDVLKYIYTGNVSVTEESPHNLIAMADYLLLPGLKTLACDFLWETVATENCVFNYYFADKYQCVELKEKSCKVIKSNFSAVMETDDFLNLDAKQVMEWVSSDDVTVSAEEEVFKGIVKWVSHNKSVREKDFPDLLHQVRLRFISHNFIVNELVKEELVTTHNDCLNLVLESMAWILSPAVENGTKPRKCMEIDGIFVCGGRKALYFLPQEKAWYELADMMLEHQNHATIQYRGKVYIFSKQRDKHDVLGRIAADYYMSSINTWGTVQTKFGYKDEKISSVVVMGENMTLYAVTDDETLSVNFIFLYYPNKCEWKLVEECNWRACGVTDGHCLYIIGGVKNDGQGIQILNQVVRFNPSGDRWEEVAAMKEARCDAFGTSMNGKIYVAGGMKKEVSFTVCSTCEMYNPSTDEWQLMPSLNAPRHSASMVCFQGALYVIGGLRDDKQSRELAVEMFDCETNEWKKKSIIPVNHECEEKEKKKINMCYKACFATVHKDALKKPMY